MSIPRITAVSGHSASAEEIEKLLIGISPRGLPAVASVLFRMLELTGVSTVEVAECLNRDPQLAGKLVRLANTVQHGAGIPVTSAEAAVRRLGADRIRSLALQYEIVSLVSAATKCEHDFDEFWQGCLARSCFARALGLRCRINIAAESMLAGFLEDIGIPFIAARSPRFYRELLDDSGGCQARLARLEWQSLHYDHIHVSVKLLEKWNAPRRLVTVIGRHHARPPASPTHDPALCLWQVSYAASLMPAFRHARNTIYESTLPRFLKSAFDLTSAQAYRIVTQAVTDFDDVIDLFRPVLTHVAKAADVFAPAMGLLCQGADAQVPEVRRVGRDRVRSMKERLPTPTPAGGLNASLIGGVPELDDTLQRDTR